MSTATTPLYPLVSPLHTIRYDTILYALSQYLALQRLLVCILIDIDKQTYLRIVS